MSPHFQKHPLALNRQSRIPNEFGSKETVQASTADVHESDGAYTQLDEASDIPEAGESYPSKEHGWVLQDCARSATGWSMFPQCLLRRT